MSKKQGVAEAEGAVDSTVQSSAEQVLATDAYAGQGGSFVFDQASAQRVPAAVGNDGAKEQA